MGPEDKLLEPPADYVMPTDVVGRRPAGQQPQGAATLLATGVISLYYHFSELLRIVLLAMAIMLALPLLSACLLREYPDWQRHVVNFVLGPLTAPLMAGLEYSVLLAIQRLFPKAREVLRPFRGGALYLNVLAAAGPAYFGAWVLAVLWDLVLFLVFGAIPLDDPALDQVLRQWLGPLFGLLLLLPLTFAGLDALASRMSFRQAIARSVGFVFRQKRLFAGYAIIAVIMWALAQLSCAAAGSGPSSHHVLRVEEETSLAAPAVATVTFLLFFLADVVVKALFYREFVWREREAAAQAPESA